MKTKKLLLLLCVALLTTVQMYGQVHNGHKYVDLGLSVKWATCNVGASSPTDYGDYFAWGETKGYNSGKREFDAKHCKYITLIGPFQGYIKCTKYSRGERCKYGSNANDGKRTLDKQDDAASVNWGGKWRMPTEKEFWELLDNCSWIYYDSGNSEFHGVAGFKVQSKKKGYENNYIFLPAAGYRDGKEFHENFLYYWLSSLCVDDSAKAEILDGNVWSKRGVKRRWLGMSVRPVIE